MIFKTKNTYLPHSWFEKKIIETLELHDQGKDVKNSPLIEFMRRWETTGGMHLDCYKAEDYEKAIWERQIKFFALYDDIKRNGYKDLKPILISFDDEGFMHLYDGHHRLAILKHLGLEVEVTVSTEWKGAVDGQSGKDFPLFETIEKTHHGRRILYQTVTDERLKGLPCSRPDAQPRLDYLKARLKGNTVLDIGCSEGYFSHELTKLGYSVIGIDIDKNLIATARYLGAIQGLKVDFRVGDWRDIVRESDHFDNIIYFSVLHNNINQVGKQRAFEDLELFRGKTDRIFIETPDIVKQPDWESVFRPDLFDRALENRTKLNIQEKWVGYRPIYLLDTEDKKNPQKVEPVKDYDYETPIEVNGYKMVCPPNDWMINGIRSRGNWETKTTEFIQKHLKKGQTFVDVGAQAGYFTLLAAQLGAKVEAFEPSSGNFRLLEKNVKLNKCKNVKLHKMALASEEGEVKLYTGKTPSEHSIKLVPAKNLTHDYEYVKAIRYSDHFPVPDMIKIDVEEGEMMVLGGMEALLKTEKPIYLIIEDWYAKVPYWLIDNYGFKLITTERMSGNWILAKNMEVETVKEPLRIHLVGPFNTPTTLADEGIGNAFASKVVRMAKILKKLGHHVIFYGVEGSDVVCDEFVQVSTKDILEKTYGKWEKEKVYGCKYGDLAHNTFNENAIREINKRKFPGDFLLCCLGNFQKPIADAVNIACTVEIGIGYTGSFARFRIFESRFQMNYTYGSEKQGDIDFYDTVIPGYFEEEDFEYSDKKDDYFLYLGRIISRKGIFIAQQVCEKLGVKLIAAGFGYDKDTNKIDAESFEKFIKLPNVEYVGFAGVEKRKKLMSKAKAVLMPTTYLEPFGYVAIEAMMSGTPVITTDGGAFPETIQHGVTGYRCRTFEEFLWAAKNIDKIKPEDCRKWAMNNYSMEKATKMYEEYLNMVVNIHGKGWYMDNPDRKDLEALKVMYN